MSTTVTPYRIEIAPAELDDLRARLRRTRWPEKETVDDWSQGIPLAYVQELCSYWADEYDWAATEATLNGYPQFRTEVDGLGIHFLHVRSAHNAAFPLVLTHGWPGSVVEFLDIIGPLVDPPDPADAFHVVCPSLPGYGFSDKPAVPGWNVARVATAWAEVMRRLGYDRYGAQGGDWGSAVTSALALADPAHCAGIHLNMVIAMPGRDDSELTDREKAAIDGYAEHTRWGTGYSTQQSTRPQTVGYGLVDSPAAQAAWIVEKFWAWTDCDGHPENVISRDRLLDNVMLYWLTASGASSARLYWESFRSARLDTVPTPMGGTIFPKEIFRPSRRWAERAFSDICFWNEPERGGHFAAMEQPSVLVDDIRATFRAIRQR